MKCADNGYKDIIKILKISGGVLSVLTILFFGVFALDSFEGDAGIFAKIGRFLVHLIPSYILAAALVLSWKKEMLGGILYIILSAAIFLVFSGNPIKNNLILSSPLIMIGITFISIGVLKRTSEN